MLAVLERQAQVARRRRRRARARPARRASGRSRAPPRGRSRRRGARARTSRGGRPSWRAEDRQRLGIPWSGCAPAPGSPSRSRRSLLLALLLARPAIDQRLGEPPGALLARARRGARRDRARLQRDDRSTAPPRRPPPPHLARVRRERALPRAARARDARRSARPERRLRARDAVRAGARGAFAAAASRSSSAANRADASCARRRLLVGVVGAIVVVWAVVSLAELPPLDDPLAAEQLDGWQLLLAAVGVALYGIAAFGFLRLHRRRQERFVLAFALAFALLAEAMVVIAWARNWQVSWWEWHVLMLASFLLIAVRRAGGVARGALQRALPRRDARGRPRGEHRARRPRRLHELLRAARPRTRSRRCSTRTSGASSR